MRRGLWSVVHFGQSLLVWSADPFLFFPSHMFFLSCSKTVYAFEFLFREVPFFFRLMQLVLIQMNFICSLSFSFSENLMSCYSSVVSLCTNLCRSWKCRNSFFYSFDICPIVRLCCTSVFVLVNSMFYPLICKMFYFDRSGNSLLSYITTLCLCTY